MKLATWNVNSLKVRLPQVLDFLTVHKPDVLCLQETKLEDDKFPASDVHPAPVIRRCFPGKRLTTGWQFFRCTRRRKSRWASQISTIRKNA